MLPVVIHKSKYLRLVIIYEYFFISIKERSVNLVNEGITLLGAALLSWGHKDGIIRIKEKKEQPQVPVIFCPLADSVTVCSTVPDCYLIWIGLLSGNILIFR